MESDSPHQMELLQFALQPHKPSMSPQAISMNGKKKSRAAAGDTHYFPACHPGTASVPYVPHFHDPGRWQPKGIRKVIQPGIAGAEDITRLCCAGAWRANCW